MARFKYEKRPHYPHLRPKEIEIWERFIAQKPDEYDEVEYDFAFGLLPPFKTEVVPETGGDDRRLYLRRVDVVAHKGDRLDFIEIKPNAGPGAIGQIKGYITLYKNLVDPKAEIVARVLTDNARADVFLLAGQEEVILSVV